MAWVGPQACLTGLPPLAVGVRGTFLWLLTFLLAAVSVSPAASRRPCEPRTVLTALKQGQEAVGEDSPPGWEPRIPAQAMMKMVSFLHIFRGPLEVCCCAFLPELPGPGWVHHGNYFSEREEKVTPTVSMSAVTTCRGGC